jgi:tungstate transport system ATP-binding protein
MSTAMIAVTDLRVVRDRRLVLEVPRITVEQGEILAVVGANGSGKSTLLQSLALLIPAEMTYQFAGQAVDLKLHSLAIRRQTAVVFQRPLLTAGSVYDNVALGLRLRHVPTGEIRQRVIKALEMFKITDLAQRASHSLSGGEAQRVSLALLQDLRRVLREGGITALFVTHDFTEILPLADRLAVLKEGRIIQTDRPKAVFRQPANAHVQEIVRAAADLIQTLDIGNT